jgi:colicin import membrane protein
MASSRYNDLILWLFISVAIHAIAATLIALSPRAKKVQYAPVYEVKLLPFTPTPVVKPEEVPQREEVRPRERPKIEAKRRGKIKEIKPKAIKKVVRDEARPEEAIAKLKEKIVAEEAIERIREKVRKKEPITPGEVKIATRPPARVYRYEELDAELRAYFQKISQMIREAWYLPDALRSKGYKTVLSIHIKRDGTIESLWIEEGSGNRSYDESTIRAINKVSPLPPLPKGWKEEAIDLGLRF